MSAAAMPGEGRIGADGAQAAARSRQHTRRVTAAVIDAKITRWAVPHYSPPPHGIVAGLVEAIEAPFRPG